ncbi:hypothetical protein QQP08_015165 [Theobroma cacao]|nr:hypothetical protein QQP08_015165 [Theobroma cacao]
MFSSLLLIPPQPKTLQRSLSLSVSLGSSCSFSSPLLQASPRSGFGSCGFRSTRLVLFGFTNRWFTSNDN